jgi:hydroxymethylpyrimidine/phosphomethylpyrimidine kinase
MTTGSYSTAVAGYLNALEAALQAVNNNTDFVQQAVPPGS